MSGEEADTATECRGYSKLRHYLCVLRVDSSVTTLPGVVFTDRNAAGGDRWVRFLHPGDWALLDFDKIYARDWRDEDQFAYYDKKRKKCAEVLVPHRIEPRFLAGAYVRDRVAGDKLSGFGFGLPIAVEPDLFFQ